MDEQNKGQSLVSTYQTIVALTQILVRAWASFIYAFIRHGFGFRYFGLIEFGGCIVPALFTLFFAAMTKPFPTILPFLGNIFIFLAMWHRIQGVRLSKSVVIHTRYNGCSRLSRWCSWDETKIKGILEPTAVCAIGFLIVGIDPPLGMFLICSTLAMKMDAGFAEERFERMREQIQDAEIESSFLDLDSRRTYRK